MLVSDQEGAFASDYARNLASQKDMNITLKAPRQKAWVVERRHELLRQAVHKVETQLSHEGMHVNLSVDFQQIYAAEKEPRRLFGSRSYDTDASREAPEDSGVSR